MAKQARGGLGIWDRLVLLAAWILTCGVVYVLGIYVGKGMPGGSRAVEDRVVHRPVTSTPPPAGGVPSAAEDITFYDTLLSGKAAPTGRAEPARPTTPARDVPAAAAPTPPPPARRSPPTASPAVGVEPAPPRVVEEPPVPPAAAARPTPPPAAPAPPRATTRGGPWSVQASPTRDRAEAQRLLESLRGRGYEASVVRVLRDGGAWYRVRVGSFASAEEASEVMQRLRREGVAQVFVASE
jgi:cell division protein FtsN